MSDAEQPFRLDDDPFAGFELQVIVDRPVYGVGDVVRITVTASNHGDRALVQRYPGPQRFVLSIRDEHHRAVATDEVDPGRLGLDAQSFGEPWLPGQMVILPSYWNQTEGPIRSAWSSAPVGPRVAPARYRARVSWLGRPEGSLGAEVPEAFSAWFDLA